MRTPGTEELSIFLKEIIIVKVKNVILMMFHVILYSNIKEGFVCQASDASFVYLLV
jgi:hypothetical protein